MAEHGIAEIYRGVVIPKYPLVAIRVSIVEMRRLIDARLDFGLSTRESLEANKIICKDCRGMEVTSFKR